jgi:pyridoxamine 5'-phosphate oxidase
MNTMVLRNLRKDYTLAGLVESDLDPDPIVQFRVWFTEAQAAKGIEPNAMTVATADATGDPSARTVLLKGLDERGFIFYSNYDSAKGNQLAANPRAELLFYWPELERQVRIHGDVERLERSASEEYFRSRPIGNQLGALASPQSTVIPNREYLQELYDTLEQQYGSESVPLPDHWGGYRVCPQSLEFWQGRKSRLHDRLRYRRDTDGGWIVERLAP